MILIQASKPAIHQIDDQLMVVVFQQYLKNLRFTEPKMYRIEGRECIYLFKTEPAHFRLFPSPAPAKGFQCQNSAVLPKLNSRRREGKRIARLLPN